MGVHEYLGETTRVIFVLNILLVVVLVIVKKWFSCEI